MTTNRILLEAAIASLPKLDGRPIATVASISILSGVSTSAIYSWTRAGKLDRTQGSLIFVDRLIAEIYRHRLGGGFPKRRTR